jgi:hypothetical protein
LSHAGANETKQLLFKAEEKALVQYILQVSSQGHPLSKNQVQEIAKQIRQEHVLKINNMSITLIEYPPISSEWVDWL